MPERKRAPEASARREEDREWPAEVAFRVYGVALGLRSNRRALRPALEAITPPGARLIPPDQVRSWYTVLSIPASGRGTPAGWRVEDDGGAVDAGADRDEAVAIADARLRMHVATYARRRIFVHAGAVAVGDGAVVLPGRSFAGKSTLVAALLRAGASYMSDEYAVIDERGRVHPFPRRISLRPPGSRRGRLHDPLGFGARIERRALPVSLVVACRFEPQTGLSLEAITPGAAMLALLDNTLPAQHAPERVWPTLAAAVQTARAFRGTRGEAAEAATAILALAR